MALDKYAGEDNPPRPTDDLARESSEATMLKPDARPRVAVMTDENGLTATELRFLRNKRIDDAVSESAPPVAGATEDGQERPDVKTAPVAEQDEPAAEHDSSAAERSQDDHPESQGRDSDDLNPGNPTDRSLSAEMTDANGLTAAELRFQRNQRIGGAQQPDQIPADHDGHHFPNIQADSRNQGGPPLEQSQQARPQSASATGPELQPTPTYPPETDRADNEVDTLGVIDDATDDSSADIPEPTSHSAESREFGEPTGDPRENSLPVGDQAEVRVDKTSFDELQQTRPADNDSGRLANPKDGKASPSQTEGGTTSRRESEADTPLERADRQCDATDPRATTDYYPNVPPTTYDRYLVRDQQNPIPVFDGPPTREQTKQGSFGDCGIVSTLGAVAGHRPDAIQNAIKAVGNGEYEVTLHDVTPATFSHPVAKPTGDTVTYKISDELPVRVDRSGEPLAGVKAESSGWAALMEKTVAAQDQTWTSNQYASWNKVWVQAYKPLVDAERADNNLPESPAKPPSGYNRIDIGSTPHQRADLLAAITGSEAEVRSIPGEAAGEQNLLDEFEDQLSKGNPILVGTRGRIPGESYPFSRRVFEFGHAYEVVKVENDKIHVRNPWGSDEYGNSSDPPPMDVKTFWEYYRRYRSDGSQVGYYTTLR